MTENGTDIPPKLTRLNLARAMEHAMSDAVAETSRQCEEVWASELPLDEKNDLIKTLNDPKTVNTKMLAARQRVLTENTP